MTPEQQVDTSTGEVTDTLPAGPQSIYIPGVKLQAHATNLARINLTGLEFRVLFAMGAQIENAAGTIAHCTVSSIAEALERNPRGIEKIFASLKRKGVIEHVRPGSWAVNPKLLYRGSYGKWAIEYPQALDPSYEINGNGLDGKRLPRDYNRTFTAPTGEQS